MTLHDAEPGDNGTSGVVCSDSEGVSYMEEQFMTWVSPINSTDELEIAVMRIEPT
jgi:hypothetical protein